MDPYVVFLPATVLLFYIIKNYNFSSDYITLRNFLSSLYGGQLFRLKWQMTTKRRQLITTKMAAVVSGLVQSHISESLNSANSDEKNIVSSFGHMNVRDDQNDIIKLGFPLSDLYKLALKFYKGKEGLGIFIIG